MIPIGFTDPNPNRVEEAVLEMFTAFATEFQSRNRDWTARAIHHFEGSGGRSPRPGEDARRSVVLFQIMCRRKCCTAFGGAPEHLVHSLEITSEFGISQKYPKYWKIYGSLDNSDFGIEGTPIERFKAVVQFNVEQPDEVYLEEVRKKLEDIPMALEHVAKDTTRWTKREY